MAITVHCHAFVHLLASRAIALCRAAKTESERPTMPEPPSAALLSEAAFARLLASAQRPLYAFVRSLVGDEEQAQDILQDVFYDAWRAALAGTPPFGSAEDEEGVRRWLFHAAYCDAASVLRRRKLID